MSTKEKKIKYAKKDRLNDQTFTPKNVRRRISMMMELDLLDALKAEAHEANLPYQTYIKLLLREHLSNKLKPEIGWKKFLNEQASDPESTFIRNLKKSLKSGGHRD